MKVNKCLCRFTLFCIGPLHQSKSPLEMSRPPPPWHYSSSVVLSAEGHHGKTSGTRYRHCIGPCLESGTT